MLLEATLIGTEEGGRDRRRGNGQFNQNYESFIRSVSTLPPSLSLSLSFCTAEQRPLSRLSGSSISLSPES